MKNPFKMYSEYIRNLRNKSENRFKEDFKNNFQIVERNKEIHIVHHNTTIRIFSDSDKVSDIIKEVEFLREQSIKYL